MEIYIHHPTAGEVSERLLVIILCRLIIRYRDPHWSSGPFNVRPAHRCPGSEITSHSQREIRSHLRAEHQISQTTLSSCGQCREILYSSLVHQTEK